MTKFLLRWVINAIALYVAILVCKGIDFANGWIGIIWLALIFGLINAILRPILKIFSLPLIVLTLGLFSLVINTFLFWLTSVLGSAFNLMLIIQPPVLWNSFLGALVVSVVSVFFNLVLRDELKGRRKRS
ncbi:MAG: phage holin family protein [Anaerolineales bacterium]|jgi:putative membrane protein